MPNASWSPDSKSLVVVDTSVDPPALVHVSVEDGARKKLTSPPANSFGDFSPAVSPDGKWLAFNRPPGSALHDWKLLPYSPSAAPQEPVSIPFGRGATNSPDFACAWTTDSTQLVCVETSRAGTRLVRLPISAFGEAGTDSGGRYRRLYAVHSTSS